MMQLPCYLWHISGPTLEVREVKELVLRQQSSVVIKIQWSKVLLMDSGHWVPYGQKVPALRSHLKEVSPIAEALLLDLWAPKDVAKNETVAYARVNATSVGFVMGELTECRLVVTPPKLWQSATTVTWFKGVSTYEQASRAVHEASEDLPLEEKLEDGLVWKRQTCMVIRVGSHDAKPTFGIAVPHKYMDRVQAATGGPAGQRWVLRGTSEHWVKSEVEEVVSMMQWNATVIGPLGQSGRIWVLRSGVKPKSMRVAIRKGFERLVLTLEEYRVKIPQSWASILRCSIKAQTPWSDENPEDEEEDEAGSRADCMAIEDEGLAEDEDNDVNDDDDVDDWGHDDGWPSWQEEWQEAQPCEVDHEGAADCEVEHGVEEDKRDWKTVKRKRRSTGSSESTELQVVRDALAASQHQMGQVHHLMDQLRAENAELKAQLVQLTQTFVQGHSLGEHKQQVTELPQSALVLPADITERTPQGEVITFVHWNQIQSGVMCPQPDCHEVISLRLPWHENQRAVAMLSWTRVSGEARQCFWRSLAMVLGQEDHKALKAQVLQHAAIEGDSYRARLNKTEDQWKQYLATAAGDIMATEIEAMLAAGALNRSVVVCDKQQEAIWLWTKAEHGKLEADSPIVLWLQHEHFWPGRGQALWSSFAMACDPIPFKGGRRRPKEWKIASLNGGGAGPVVNQLREWEQEHFWQPDVVAFQEHRLSASTSDSFVKKLRSIGYKAHLGPSLSGKGPRVCRAGVGVAVRKHVASSVEMVAEEVLQGRALAVHFQGLLPGGVKLLVVYLSVDASEQHRLEELAAISRWIGDFNEQPDFLRRAGWLEHVGGTIAVTENPTTVCGRWIDFFVGSVDVFSRHWAAVTEEAPVIKVHKPIMLSLAGLEPKAETIYAAVKQKQLPEDRPYGPVREVSTSLDVQKPPDIENKWL
eukprot:6485283-Amphidinium_carterae.1